MAINKKIMASLFFVLALTLNVFAQDVVLDGSKLPTGTDLIIPYKSSNSKTNYQVDENEIQELKRQQRVLLKMYDEKIPVISSNDVRQKLSREEQLLFNQWLKKAKPANGHITINGRKVDVSFIDESPSETVRKLNMGYVIDGNNIIVPSRGKANFDKLLAERKALKNEIKAIEVRIKNKKVNTGPTIKRDDDNVGSNWGNNTHKQSTSSKDDGVKVDENNYKELCGDLPRANMTKEAEINYYKTCGKSNGKTVKMRKIITKDGKEVGYGEIRELNVMIVPYMPFNMGEYITPDKLYSDGKGNIYMTQGIYNLFYSGDKTLENNIKRAVVNEQKKQIKQKSRKK